MSEGRDAAIRLAPVTDGNREAIAALTLEPAQAHFVAANAASLAEAEEDADARPRAILCGDRLIGFLMYEAPEGSDEARLYRFMIDPAHQGRGYGRAALQAVLAEIRGLGPSRDVSICYDPGNEAARHLYGQAGFVEDGLDEDGEMIARLPRPGGPA